LAALILGWHAQLSLHYTHKLGATSAHDRHEGPLRVLQRLYPEGPAICHHVIVHPPGGVVGGDELHVNVESDAGSHAVITTPGATRFYRSEGALARQVVRLTLAAGARLEWLPLEAIAYSGCQAQSQLLMNLAPGAEVMGWDVLALGLPAADKAFEQGSFEQHLALPGVWLERGRLVAGDKLLQSPLGLAGHAVLATAWWASGSALHTSTRDAMLDAARACAQTHLLAASAGVTAPQAQVLLLRVLAPRVEPAMQLLMQVRAAWRQLAWGLKAEPPRIWRT
jgi:urease accessory protein